MTAHKHFKQIVRSRIEKTGESYTSARRQILDDAPREVPQRAFAPKTRIAPWHFAGRVPATTALRSILTAAAVMDPITNKPLTESMLFGIAGGIGAGVAQFRYEKEDFSSFFLAGRHLWHDDEAYLTSAITRIGMRPAVLQSSGGKSAEKHLRDSLKDGRPCIAWVDMAHLPHRAMPAHFSGGGDHVITVYSIDDDKCAALIGDLAEDPIEIPLADLATARARIRKFKNRILRIENTCGRPWDLGMRVRSGIKACHAGLGGKPMKKYPTMFNLDAFANWGKRIFGSKDKDSWDRVFPRGKHLWTALTWMYDCIEHRHSGGGLCRKIYAEFLAESAESLKDSKLRSLSNQYSKLARLWSDLANATLPKDLPLMRQARELYDRKSTRPAADRTRRIWQELASLQPRAAEKFPLSADECDSLRQDLQRRVLEIRGKEVVARDALASVG